MASTNAERQRRYRAHRRGDHSLCSPERCDGTSVTPSPVTGETRNEGVAGLRVPRLGKRGRWLWEQLVEGGDPGPADRVLIEEACRLADRLDRLDAISNGKDRAWLEIADDLAYVAEQCDGEVTVVVDKVLSEARQQQATLKQLLAELRQSQAGSGAGGKRPGAAGAAPTGMGGGGVADLTARIAGRSKASAG